MAQFTGPSISELPGWRIGLIFLLFCIIAIAYDHGSGALDRYLKKRHKRALRHVVRRLQGELLVLGLLSLLLVAFESYLLRICLPCSDSCAWDCPEREAAAEGSGRRRLLAALLGDSREGSRHSGGGDGYGGSIVQMVDQGSYRGGGGRVLLASSDAQDELSCLQAAETCPPGSEPFWSQLAIVQAHLFLFTIAVVHICYACISMLLCLWKLRRWQRFERDALNHELRPLALHSRFLPRPGDNALTHALRCAVFVATDSVNSEVYCGLRRLFIERLDVHPSFDFHGFLVESMEEEFAGIVGVNSVLWCIVLLWIMLPPNSYQLIWLSALAVSAAILVAVKLQSIITSLAEDAYLLYGCPESEHASAPSMLQSVKLRLQRLSPFGGGRQRGGKNSMAPNGAAGSLASGSPLGTSSLDASASRRGQGQLAQGQLGQLVQQQTGQGGQQQGEQQGAADSRSSVSKSSASAVPNGTAGALLNSGTAGVLPLAPKSSAGSELDVAQLPEAGVAGELANRGARPEQAAAVAAAVVATAHREAHAEVAGLFGRSSRQAAAAGGAGGDGSRGQGEGRQTPPQAVELGQLSARQQQQQLECQLGTELSFDLEAQAQPEQAARAAADAADKLYPTSSVFRRCCPWLLPRLPWHRVQQRQRVSGAVERSQSFAATYRGPDAAQLFWFGKPRFVLRVIQGIYFENSLSVAAALFSLWQQVDFDWAKYGGWGFLGAMIAVELVMLLFMSCMVLPVYALTTAAGSHSAASVIQHALKFNIKPDIARALQRMSMQAREAEEEGEEDGSGGDGAQPDGDPTQQQLAAASSRAAVGAAPWEDTALEEWPRVLLPRPIGGRPSLARHSAPLPGMLSRLSPAFGFVPSAPGSPTAAAAAGGEGLANVSPFGAAAQQAGGPHDAAAEFDQEIDSAAVAAAAAAEAVGKSLPSETDLHEQRSLTKLMGAMYQKQLQRHLERTSSRRSNPRPRRLGSGTASSGTAASQDLSGHSMARATGRKPSLASLTEEKQQQQQQQGGVEKQGEGWEHPGAVETCPAAVGGTWLPELMQQLGPSAATPALPAPSAARQQPSSSGVAVAKAGVQVAAGPSADAALGRSTSSSCSPGGVNGSSHPTLAQVRSLFDTAAAAGADESRK